MEMIPVQQWGERYFFRWAGTSFMVGMQLMQQQNSPIVVRLRRQPVMQLWQQHEQASGDKDK